MTWKVAEFERAIIWNDSQSCLSMRSSRMAIEFSILVEDIVSIRNDSDNGGVGVANLLIIGIMKE